MRLSQVSAQKFTSFKMTAMNKEHTDRDAIATCEQHVLACTSKKCGHQDRIKLAQNGEMALKFMFERLHVIFCTDTRCQIIANWLIDLLWEKPPNGYMWSGERRTRQRTSASSEDSPKARTWTKELWFRSNKLKVEEDMGKSKYQCKKITQESNWTLTTRSSKWTTITGMLTQREELDIDFRVAGLLCSCEDKQKTSVHGETHGKTESQIKTHWRVSSSRFEHNNMEGSRWPNYHEDYYCSERVHQLGMRNYSKQLKMAQQKPSLVESRNVCCTLWTSGVGPDESQK